MSDVRRKTGTAVAALLLGFCMAVTAYAGQTAFASGVKVNGVSVSGRSVPDAVSILREYYASYTLTVLERNGKTEKINGSDIGYTANISDELVQSVLDSQGTAAGNISVAVPCTYDEETLKNKIGSLNCIAGTGVVTTSDAGISDYQAGKAYTIIPEVYGNSVDRVKFLQAVKDAIAGGQSSVSIEGTGSYTNVNVKKNDAGLKNRLDAMNRIRTMTITYHIGGGTETLDSGTIVSWITGANSDGGVNVNSDAASAWINAMAAKYNTANTTRTFHTYAGADIALDGPLGWSMDTAGETQALLSLIQQEKSAERTVDKPAADWGNSYIEADLAAQHVYCFQDGNVVWDSDCVSGSVKASRQTPAGLFYVYTKETNRILKGPMKDGKPEYESHVDYWMPFYESCGLHDASWRNKFGGDIYINSGSHGCINLPPAKAAELYGMVGVRYPCIVHY